MIKKTYSHYLSFIKEILIELLLTQSVFICSKSTRETPEQFVKFVQS